ncbi:hypothetical protein IAJ44_004236 [Salmonella enterica]|nr:hypothetical protein [Salmonella enterica]
MNLRKIIDHYYGGNQQHFSEAVGVSHRTVRRWVAADAAVERGVVMLPVRELPAVPDIAPDYRRDDFEAMMKQASRRSDLTRVGEHYVCPNVQKMWQGWQLAQEFYTTEALIA